jgi:hypothetical protein
MDPLDFNELASELANSNNPAKIRTAINRAYYAAYNTGFKILKDMGLNIKQASKAHKEVKLCLDNSDDGKIEKAGSELGVLYTRRIQADYHLGRVEVENPKTAKGLVRNAEEIMLSLKLCVLDKPRYSRVTKVIQKWWTEVYRGILKENHN